jgi:hypothetical protein
MRHRKPRPRSIPFFVALFCTATLLLPAALFADDENPQNDLERDYVALTKVTLDTGSAARLENFTFKRDCLDVTFKRGTLYLAQPLDGAVTGAVFIGSGTMKVDLPDDIEREQLEKYIDKRALEEPFTNAFFRFDDDTAELFTMAAGAAGDGDEARRLFEIRGEALRNLKNNVEFDVLTHRSSGRPYGGTFYGEFDTAEHGWVSFTLAPDAEEEVFIFQHSKAGASGSTRKTDLWCQFDQLADRDKPESVRYKQNKDDIDVAKCTMDLTIRPRSLVLDNRVNLDLVSRRDGLNTIRFAFLHEGVFGHPGKVKVLSLTDSAGSELEYVHRNHEIMIRLGKTLNEGDRDTLNFVYEGDIIAPIFILGDMAGTPGGRMPAEFDFLPSHPVSFQLLNTYPWYPQYGYLRRSYIDWTVKVPKPNLAVVSGDTVRTWEEGDLNCIQTTFDAPVMLPSIIFGEFHLQSNAESRDEGAPIINVYSLAKQKGEAGKILAEAEQIVKYLESLYGPYPYKELDIAQMSFFMGFGQAPPGLVQLTGEAYLTEGQMSNISTYGDPEFRSPFMAHEIGHQWWAHVVGWRTYHDQWLSEAFTEYSSAMYMNVLDGPSGFQEDMDGWWENAMQLKDAGPISLGGRLGGRDYVYALYDKGPYVVHMLRMALISQSDPDKGTTLFVTALRNFLDEYRHQNPTTTDLQRVVSKTVGMDMDWFFDQWFRGSGIPKMHFSYDVRPTEDGKWLLEGRILQDAETAVNVIIPIYYEFGRNQYDNKILWVNKPDFTFKAKLPAKPKKVELNKSEDVLAEIIRD